MITIKYSGVTSFTFDIQNKINLFKIHIYILETFLKTSDNL